MANLAIKGHATRSKEVIEILEMLGGTNSESCWGVFENRLYTINAFGIIEDKSSRDNSNYQVYTLEEFLEKFPYKVGDRVKIPNCDVACRVTNMIWNGIEIEYETTNSEETVFADELQPYKEQETMEELKINLSPTQMDGEQIIIPIPKGYEFVGVDDDKQQVVFKKIGYHYPKTYDECCEVLGYSGNYNMILTTDVDNKLFEALYRLKVCRDAYWKLAGEQMGLGKPWEPDWRNSDEDKYCIEYSYGRINPVITNIYNYILAFPTKEMRDVFLENFWVLIEICKELL